MVMHMIFALMFVVHGGPPPKIATERIEFGYQGFYDGLVNIFRDARGRLVFQDVDTATTITLGQLAGVRSAGRLVTVSPVPGTADTTTIADAIADATALNPSAESPVTIRVFPGVYAEQGLVIPDHVSLVGVDPRSCVIEKASTNYNGRDARSSALVHVPYNGCVMDLTIHNSRTAYPSTALDLGWDPEMPLETRGNAILAENLVVVGRREDVLYTSGANRIVVRNCEVYSTGGGDIWSASVPAGSMHSADSCYIGAEGWGAPAAAIWMTGGGVLSVTNTRLRADSSSTYRGAIRFSDSAGTNGTARFTGCRFETQQGDLGRILEYQTTGSGWKVELSRTAYDCTNSAPGVVVASESMGDAERTFGSGATFAGTVRASGISSSGDVTAMQSVTAPHFSVGPAEPDVDAFDWSGRFRLYADASDQSTHLFLGGGTSGGVDFDVDHSTNQMTVKGQVTLGSGNTAVTVNDVLRLTPRAAPPASPHEGEVYYNSDDHHAYCWDGSTWRALW